MSGQKEKNNKQRGLGREEGRISKEVKGSQTGENGRSLMVSDRESVSGKALRDTLCHAPIPDPTQMMDPNRVRDARPCTGTLYLLN